MDPLSLAASIAGLVQISGLVISFCYDYGCAVSSAPTEQRQLLNEITTLSGLFVGLQSRVNAGLSDSSDSTYSVGGVGATVRECQVILREIADKLEGLEEGEIVGEKKRVGVRGKFRMGLKRALWPFKQKETMDLVERLERQKATLTMTLGADTMSIVQETRTDIKGIKVEMETARVQQEVERRMEQKRETLRWLCKVDYREMHAKASSQQMPGTGTWFIESHAMKSWLKDTNSFLWLYGIPGSGKTVLTSHILNECIIPFCSSTDLVAYFYCDFRDANSQKPESVVGALLCQLGLQLQSWPSAVDESMTRHTRDDGQVHALVYEELQILLLQVLDLTEEQGSKSVTVVIDALDECNDREGLLQLLSSLPQRTGSYVKVLVTSRREIDIQRCFHKFPQISLQESAVDKDVRKYLAHTMKTSSIFGKLSDSLKDLIVTSLTLGSNGMFRWVQCQIEELSRLRTNKAIRQALNSLPKGLDETYQRILLRIHPSDTVMARRALTWLAYASCPLLLEELAEAAVLEPGTRDYNPEALLRDPEDILEVCGSLVWHRNTTGEVVLAHHSVKDFLCSQTAQARVEFYHLEEISSNAELAKSCLTYLLLSDFAGGPAKSGQELTKQYINYPLLDFAVRHWCEHAVPALSADKELYSLAMELMDPKCTPNFMSWVQKLLADPSYGDIEDRWDRYPKGATPLYFAASFGLFEVVKGLLEAGVNLNDHGGSYGGTALHAAAWREHPEIVRMLLEAGADHTLEDENDATAYDLADWTGGDNTKRLFRRSDSELSTSDEMVEISVR